MTDDQRAYHAYLLRLWRVNLGRSTVWHARLGLLDRGVGRGGRMKSRLSSLALHPTHWLFASLVAAGVILVALGASRIAPVVGGALVALSVGGLAYLVTRSLQAVNRDLQQQLAERTDALNQALVQLQTEANRTRNLLEAIGAIIHSIADSVIVVDRAGAILIANPAAQRLIAPSASEAIGAPLVVWLRDACSDEEREHVIRSIQLQVQRAGLKVQWAELFISSDADSRSPVPRRVIARLASACSRLKVSAMKMEVETPWPLTSPTTTPT
jgi:PAS domain-containing protein